MNAGLPLPQAFVDSIRQLLGEQTEAFLSSLNLSPTRALRYANRRKHGSYLWNEGPIPWAQQAYYFDEATQPGAHPLHWAGAYYIQDASAMAPVIALAPKPFETVLDLCAAPGGKATQIADLMQGRGLLIANDAITARAQVLSRNIERMGIRHAVVLSERAENLAARFPQFFDKILVDAPCSGEGMFRKDVDALRQWQPDLPIKLAQLQRQLLRHAARMLRPGGRLVYSTCTFNRVENEEVIVGFLTEHPDFSLQAFSLPGLPPASNGTLRIWPHQVQGEGHFVALLQRSGNGEPTKPSPHNRPDAHKQSLQEVNAQIAQWVHEPPIANYMLGSTFVSLPEACPDLQGLRVLRLGLHLAQRVGSTLRPEHALALAGEPVHQIPLTLEEAIRYRAGHTLPVDMKLSGYAAVTLDGWPLGWGKAVAGVLKNHYPKGLRALNAPDVF